MKPPLNLRLTFDCVVLSVLDRELHVALARRQKTNEIGETDPFPEALSLPGGYVRDDEAIADTIRRRLGPEIGLNLDPIQFGTFDDPKRDPRHRVVSVAYLALIRSDLADRLNWGKAYESGSWHAVSALPKTGWAFDHDQIVRTALEELRYRARREPTGFELLPEHFHIRELHKLQEQLRQEPIDIRNFRKSLLRSGLLVDKGEVKGGPGLPKKIYRLDRRVFTRLREKGFHAAD
jgi:8-oxo-dGTP diphosphatase